LEATLAASQSEKGALFQRLHQGPTFVIGNAWDGGSARVLASAGFAALATSSGAAAATLGRRDGELNRDQTLAHAAVIVSATELPVAADLENGFGDSLAEVMTTIRMASEVGLVGGSIEDATGDPQEPIFHFDRAVERVAAAVEAARSLKYPFVLTARTENFLRGRADLEDTIRRLVAFERAGADVLFAPGLPDLASVRAICGALKKPVNFMVGLKGKSFSVAELAEAGVRRISLAGSVYRAALASVRDVAKEVLTQGTFAYLDRI
jgi:2-methylisocitrate lyase-like PEP mutase family enzyme